MSNLRRGDWTESRQLIGAFGDHLPDHCHRPSERDVYYHPIGLTREAVPAEDFATF